MSDGTKPGADNKATPEELATARADAAKAERSRVSGILACDEAKGREALASHIAMNTDMSLEAAKSMLAAAPKTEAAPAAKGNAFKAAMDADKHPAVGSDDTAGAADAPTGAAGILAAARAAGVRMAAAKS